MASTSLGSALTPMRGRPFPKPSPEAEARAAEAREREEAELRRKVLGRVPERYRSASLHSLPKAVRDYAADPQGNLVLSGPAGVGKTYAACAVALAFDPTKRVEFATGADMLSAIQATYGSWERGTDVLVRFSAAPLLVVDDLGKERPTPWALEKLYQVVNARYNRMLPTVYTTQYSGNELAARLAREGGDAETAQALIRRIAESAVTVRMGR